MFYFFVIGIVCAVTLSFQLETLISNRVLLILTAFIITVIYLFYLGNKHFNFELFKTYKRSDKQVSRANQNYTLNQFLKKFNFTKIGYIAINFILGLTVGLWVVHIQAQFQPNLDRYFVLHKSTEKQWHTLTISSIPKIEHLKSFSKINFTAEVHSNQYWQEGSNLTLPLIPGQKLKVTVSWYLSNEEFQALNEYPELGESWRFFAKFKPIHGSMNPHSRDYETWLFQKGIRAKLVVSGLRSPKLKNNRSTAVLLDSVTPMTQAHIRQRASYFYQKLFVASDFYPIYQALLIGDKSLIKQEQWELFRKTGTIHLMAISGLHMSIMAAIGFLVAKGLWWLIVYRQKIIDLPMFSAFTAIVFATFYLMLSGGDIPTQRAWIMVAVLILFLTLKRKFQPFSALAMAVFCVILWDEKSVLSSGFWLSFTAVVLIFATLNLFKGQKKWQSFLTVQFVLSVGLIPLVVWQYAELPLYSLIANLVAVPFITFIGLPILILISIVGLFSNELAQELISLSDSSWELLWRFLEWIHGLPVATIEVVTFGNIALFISYFGLYLVFKWFGYLNKTMGVGLSDSFKVEADSLATTERALVSNTLLFLGVIFAYISLLLALANMNILKPAVERDSLILTVLDVGQGLSVVMETEKSLSVYDTGAKWGGATDAAKVALIPYLKNRGADQVNRLIVSHSDLDHAGGSLSLLESTVVEQQLSGQPQKLNSSLNKQLLKSTKDNKANFKSFPKFKQCEKGMSWRDDNVVFEILSPIISHDGNQNKKRTDNDWSCVLKITIGDLKVLIMGDLGARYERILMNNGTDLRADILIAGHHGSHYSTSTDFLKAVQPKHVVFSSGYLNRFKFPHAEVIARLERALPNSFWWNTACSGALTFYLTPSSVTMPKESRKTQRKWYHHRCSLSQQGVLFQ